MGGYFFPRDIALHYRHLNEELIPALNYEIEQWKMKDDASANVIKGLKAENVIQRNIIFTDSLLDIQRVKEIGLLKGSLARARLEVTILKTLVVSLLGITVYERFF